MAPVHNVSSFSVASTSPASSSSFSKVIKSGDFRREPSEGEDRLHSVTSKGVSFSDSLFENARERFHHKVRRILDDWDMTGGIDDSWFGKEAILRREFDPERVNEHSGESEENVYAAISENGDYEIRMDIVKMSLKDVRVRVSGQRRVVVEGSKLEEREMTLCRHSQRRVLYQFSLPDDAKMDAISATFSCDGTLIISIPTTKVIVYEKSGSSFEKDKQQTIHSETRNSRHYSTVAHQNVLESSQGSTMLVKEKEKESQQLCRNKNNCISEMEKSNSVFQTRASDVTCASDSSAEALISDGHLQKDGRSKEIIIPIRMVESDDIAERSQEMACSKESRECSSSSKQLSSTYRQNNHHASVGSEATLSTQAEKSIVQQRQTQKQSLAATETLSKTSNEELLLENGITMNGHRNEDHQTLTVTTTDTETSDRKTYGHRRTSRLKISDDRLNPCEKVCCDKIQLVDEMTTAWDAHDSEGHSTGSHVEGKQSHDSDEMHTKSLASDSSVTLEIREKGSFLEDLHFVSVREAMTSALHEILSKYIAVPSDDDLLSSYRQLQEQNAVKHSETLSITQEDDTHYKIVIDVCSLRRTGIAVFLRNRNEIHVVGQPLQQESDCQVSELSKCFALPEDISSVDTSTSLSSDGFLMITVVKKGNSNELATEEDNGKTGFLTAARDDAFETRRQTLTTESSASSQSTVVHEGHLAEPHSSSQFKEKDTLTERGFSSTSDQMSTNLKNSCTSISLLGLKKELPCSTAKHESETTKSPSVLGNSISSEYNETTAFVSATDATSVEIQEEQKPNDISLLEATFIGNENSGECRENSTYTEQTEEYQQYTTGTSKGVESEKEADTSVNSLSFVDQNFDANDLESGSSVIEETSEETSSVDNCIVLNVQGKGLFDEDIFFQNIRHKLQTKEKKFLSRVRDLSSTDEDLSDEENLSVLNDQDENHTFTSIDDGDQFMIIMDVSKYLNVKEMQLEVIDSNAMLIKGSAVTDRAEYGDVKTFSKRLGLPGGIDVESAHCVISEDGVLVVAFSKVTSAATKRISMDDTSQICIGDDECPDYGGRMQSTSVEAISNIDSDSKDFMQSMTYGHRASCGVDTSAQTERSAENNLSAEVNYLSGDIHDSPTTGHSTNNDTNPETIEDTSDALDVGPKFDERCVGALSVQGSNENEKIHIWNTSCELGQTLQRGLDNVVNVPSFDSHKMEDSTIEDFCDTFNTETASCFIADSSLRISEKEKATSSAEETSANEKTLMKERREDDFSDSIGGNDLREMEENINTTSFKNITLSSFQAEQQRSASDYEENQVMSSRANDRMLVRKDSNESAGDLEHQNELQTFSYVAQKAVKGYFCPENYVTLKVQEKGLFAEDTFFESARRHFLEARGETLPKLGSLPSVSGEPTNTKKLYCIDHLDENKVATFIEDEQYCLIILDVSCYLEKEMVKVSVIEEKELSVEYSCAASDSELEFMNTFSTRLVLPSGIDSESGLCGISSDGILTVKFSKQKHAGCHKEERREDGVTQHWLNEEQNLANTTNFFQNRDYISSEAKSDILVVGDSKELSNKTFSRFKIHSDSSDIQEHNSINVTMLPFIKRGHFFQDSFFTEAHRLLQVAIKRVLLQCSKGETCRHSSDIKTYKCLRKQNPTWQNQAFHAEEDQYSCKVLLDTESLSEGSTMVYVMEGTKLVIENQLQMKVGSSSLSLQTCRRSFSLPPNVDINEATSALSSDGLLYIVFSKRDIP